MCVLWLIWKNRNKFMFGRRENLTVDIVDDKVHDEVSLWFLAQQLNIEGEEKRSMYGKGTKNDRDRGKIPLINR